MSSTPRYFVNTKPDGTAVVRYWMRNNRDTVFIANFRTREAADAEAARLNAVSARRDAADRVWMEHYRQADARDDPR
jgi:uncharacterized protein YaiI (UPF0178 family)